MQNVLHNTEPIGHAEGLTIEFHYQQKIRIAKVVRSWQGKNQECLLADMMGLGKTIQAIVACRLDKKRVGGVFNLTVTTKTCVEQWRQELLKSFDD